MNAAILWPWRAMAQPIRATTHGALHEDLRKGTRTVLERDGLS